MNVLLKMLLLSILMIVGFGLLMAGTVILSVGKSDGIAIGIGLLAGGICFGPTSLYLLIKLNREFQEAALDEVLKNPERILFRFPNKEHGDEIIIADNALFIGKKHHPFNSIYENLVALRQEGNELVFDFEVITDTTSLSRSKKIQIPGELSAQTQIWVEKMQKMLSV